MRYCLLSTDHDSQATTSTCTARQWHRLFWTRNHKKKKKKSLQMINVHDTALLKILPEMCPLSWSYYAKIQLEPRSLRSSWLPLSLICSSGNAWGLTTAVKPIDLSPTHSPSPVPSLLLHCRGSAEKYSAIWCHSLLHVCLRVSCCVYMSDSPSSRVWPRISHSCCRAAHDLSSPYTVSRCAPKVSIHLVL